MKRSDYDNVCGWVAHEVAAAYELLLRCVTIYQQLHLKTTTRTYGIFQPPRTNNNICTESH